MPPQFVPALLHVTPVLLPCQAANGVVCSTLPLLCSCIPSILQVPVRIFVTQQLPKTATGKIQRRMMVEHFIKGPGQKEEAGAAGKPSQPRSKL